MRIDTVLVFILMVLKLVSVVPLAFELYGNEMGLLTLTAVVVAYPTLMYLCETEKRSVLGV